PSGANHSRIDVMIYPSGKEVDYDYEAGIDDDVSRPSWISYDGGTVERYDYLGFGTVVSSTNPDTGISWTYIKQTGESDGEAGDKYVGLDRFGRVVDQRWIDGSGADVDRYQYGYDADGNVNYKLNTLNTALSELYGYDGLGQVTSFARGTLNSDK